MNIKKILSIVLLLMMALIMPQTMKAQEEGDDDCFFWYMHEKDNNPYITLDTEPEDVISYLLLGPGGENYMLKSGTWPELQRKVTDSFGNVHVTINQKSDPKEFSDYQLVLHFRPDGSLYYKNGTLTLQPREASQNAKSLKPQSRISAERASIIATGSPMSETVVTIANHENKPRDAYKVKDFARMQYVYVDAYNGEVLYTIPVMRSFAPWVKVEGSAVTLSANTSYNGLQELTMMQTDKGYILRDPDRNIVTIDATDKLADRDSTNLPEEDDDQAKVLMDETNDVSFADEEELRTQQYTTNIKGLSIWLEPNVEETPESITLRVSYSSDEESNSETDIINFTIDDAAWTDDKGRKKCSFTFDEKPGIDLISYTHVVELTLDDDTYSYVNLINAGDRKIKKIQSVDKSSKVECLFDVEVDARQQAIDVHWAIQKIYDMYYDNFGIKGCDGKGCQIVNIVNPGNNIPAFSAFPSNAVALGQEVIDSYGKSSYIMCYGMGDAASIRPMTTYDVTAHEFTHNVTAGCCNNLLYKNESGAINEALADCMAMVAEVYLLGGCTWAIGEDIMINSDNLRSLSNPWYSGAEHGEIDEDDAQPKYYAGRYWLDYTKDPKTDHGGVHCNSGVFNHLFYLLCQGADDATNEVGETRSIIPVGMDTMKDIVFHTMRYYNASLCGYKEIADNLMMAIEDMYSDNQETVDDLQGKLLNAYEHVGMESGMFPTGITRHQMSDKAKNSRTYNLYGIPVGKDYKGIVIKDGKKTLNN